MRAHRESERESCEQEGPVGKVVRGYLLVKIVT